MQIINVSSKLNNSQVMRMQTYNSLDSVNFGNITATPQKSKFFNRFKKPLEKYNAIKDKYVHEPLAKALSKFLSTKPIKNIIEKTKNYDLLNHLMTFTSTVLSGFYIRQTLKNDKLDERKRKTLAINQAVVFLLSTIGCYAGDKATNKWYDKKIVSRFAAVNHNLERDTLKKYLFGFSSAKKIMIFGFIYRYLTPVIATPIANHIGNKLCEKP